MAASFAFPTYPPLSTFPNPNPTPVQATLPLHVTIPPPAAGINSFSTFFRPKKPQHAHSCSLDLIMAYPNSQDLLTSPVDPQTMPQPVIHAFPSRLTGTTTYIVVDPVTEEAAVINPILDLDPLTNEIKTRSADRLLKFISDEGLTIKFILETTLHRDRISACRYLQLTLAHIGDGVIPKVCIGENSFCTCEDDSDIDSASPSSPQQSQPQSHAQHARNASTATTSSSGPLKPRSPTKSPTAFDYLFADNEPIRIGNMVAQCEHLDDHEGVIYIVAQHAFSSGSLARADGKDPSQGVVTHPEPPPEKTNGAGPVSSRATPTIDEVLGSAEKLSLESGSNGSGNGTEGSGDGAETQKAAQMEVKVSPMLAFYAEQVNTRGGRIPRKINLPGGRKGSVSSPPGGAEEGESGGGGKGKERERERSPAEEAVRRRVSVNGPGQPVPLRIPRKLGVIMC